MIVLPPTIDNSGQTAIGSGVASVTITSFAVGQGSFRFIYLVASRFSGTDRTVTSAVFNGTENLVPLDTHSQGIFGGTQRVDIWYLKNPSVATANLVVNFSGIADEIVCGALSLFGVHPAGPFGQVAKNADTSLGSNASVTFTTTAEQLAFDAVVAGDDGTPPTATGTQHWNLENAANNTRGLVQHKAGGGTTTLDWTGDHMSGFVTMGVGINGVAVSPLINDLTRSRKPAPWRPGNAR